MEFNRNDVFKLTVVYDEIHKLHRDPYGRHPERPERLDIALNSLRSSPAWSLIKFVSTSEPNINPLLKIHEADYVEFIKLECSKGFHYIDPDTYVNEYTFNVAARFATSAYEVASKAATIGGLWLIMPRPGGHHAGVRGRALGAPTLGFCIFNYAAIAAKTLLEAVRKVLIIDFDAHHGNGTQEVFWYEPNVVHIDIHEGGIYPGTGLVTDVGGSGAEGSKINIPLPAGSGDPQYMWILRKVVEPLVNVFKPEAVVVSAGFDAYVDDPLTDLEITESTYLSIGSYLNNLLKMGIIKSVVTNLEGGYGKGISSGFKSYIEGLVGISKASMDLITPVQPPKELVRDLSKILQRYWGLEL